MPQSCPPIGYCGTHAPIWLHVNETEVDGVTLGYACVSGENYEDVTPRQDCCMYSWPIRIRHCEAGNFTVYELTTPPSCNMAYCAQSQEDFNLFLERPRISTVISNNRVHLNCSFNTASQYKDFKISWFKLTSDGSHVSVTSQEPIRTQYSLLDVTQYLLPGEEVQCEVELVSKRYSTTSLPYFVGLRVTPVTFNLTSEMTEVTLNVIKTLPLICKECDLKLKLSTEPMQGSRSSLLFSACEATISGNSSCLNDGDCGTTSVLVKAQSIHSKHVTVHAILTRGVDSWWAQHPPININVQIEGLKQKQCHIFTQSHVISFNRHTFDLKSEGIFTLFRDNVTNAQVEVRIQACSGDTDGLCVCGLAAREDSTVVRLDKCGLDVPILNVNSRDMNSVRILESRHGKIITMIFDSGWLVRTHNSINGLSVTMTSRDDVSGNSEGLCVMNDVIGEHENWSVLDSESLLYTSPYISSTSKSWSPWCACESTLPSCTSPSPPALLRSYLDITDEVVLGSQVSQLYSIVDQKGLTIPSENDVYFEVHEMPLPSRTSSRDANKQRGLGRGIEWDLGPMKHHNTLENKPIEMRLETTTVLSNTEGTTYSNDVESYTSTVNEYDTTQEFITTERNIVKKIVFHMSENEAHAMCLNSLLNSTLGRECSLIMDSEDLLINLQLCVNDVTQHGVSWSKLSVPLLEDMCEFGLTSSAPSTLIDALNCPETCSGHGVCLELGCICDPGYTREDCSQLSAQSPILNSISDNGRCDISKHGHCHKVPVKGEGFARAKTLICKIRTNQPRGEDDNQVQEYPVSSNDSLEVTAQFISTGDVECMLPRWKISSLQTSKFLIAVSNDGNHFSNWLSLFVFDSRCVTCDVDNTCTARSNVCVIDDTCVYRDTHKPGDTCRTCQPHVANTTWTKAYFPPRFTTQNESVSAVSLRAFLGQELHHRFSALDPRGLPLRFSLVVPVHLARYFDPKISIEGELRWRPNTEGSRTMTVSASNTCNVTSHLRVVIVTSRCPCHNSGVCTLNYDNHVVCACRRGFLGLRCERPEVTSCGSCGAHGRCVPGRGCRCESGYSGPWCTLKMTPCTPTSCPLGATCLPISTATFRCSFCPWRHSASGRCIEPPHSNPKRFSSPVTSPRCSVPCSNGGRCLGHNMCSCVRGWGGPTCQLATCKPVCENGGVCWKPNRCSCPRGYRGRRCNKPICSPSCKRTGLRCVAPNTCQPKSASFQSFKHYSWLKRVPDY